MIPAALKDEELLHDIAAADPGAGVCLWWLGQSGFLVKSSAGLALLDPYLSDSLTRKYAGTKKPHVRMTEIPIRSDRLPPLDLVTSSHNHTDHLDAETLVPLLQASSPPKLVIPEANRPFVAQRLHCDLALPIGLADGARVRVSSWTVHGVVAAHDAIERDEAGRPRCMGYVLQSEHVTIYHSGDTRWDPELNRQLAPFRIDVAILPINGALPTRQVAGNLWGQEAAALAHSLGAKLVIPCHYEMFQFNTETPDAFVAKCRELRQPYHPPRCGERITVPA